MKVDRISYKKIFPLGSYINETIGVEIDVHTDDAVLDVLAHAKFLVEKFHKDNNPQLMDGSKPDFYAHRFDPNMIPLGEPNFIPKPLQSIDRKAIERLEILIDDCTSMDELVKYKDEVGSVGLIDLYHAKFDQLMREDAERKLINQ